LGVDYKTNKGGKGDSLQFIFFGGILNENEIKKIKLNKKELTEFKFVKIAKALPLLVEGLRIRLPKCLDALKRNEAVYLENGK
jgi:8-oxo-dGTP diphosphatase